MKLFDTSVEDIKRTTPGGFIDIEWVTYFAILLFLLVIQLLWVFHIEKLYDQAVSIHSCFGRRLRERISNREWNDMIITFCNKNGIHFYSGGDARVTAYVGFHELPSKAAGDTVNVDDAETTA